MMRSDVTIIQPSIPSNSVYLRFWLLTLTMCGIYEPLKNINNMIEVPSVLKTVSFIVKEGNNLLSAILFWAFWNCLKEMIDKIMRLDNHKDVWGYSDFFIPIVNILYTYRGCGISTARWLSWLKRLTSNEEIPSSNLGRAFFQFQYLNFGKFLEHSTFYWCY